VAKAKGLYANIHAKRKRIKAGSGESMRRPGAKGAPTKANFVRSAKTAKNLKRKINGKSIKESSYRFEKASKTHAKQAKIIKKQY